MSKKFKNIGMVDYEKMIIPDDYRCDGCGVHGVKLWREYQVTASKIKLFCVNCAEKDQKRGRKTGWGGQFLTGKENQIECLVPAVPLEGQDIYWGYALVPESGVNWWKNLPLKK